jgi:N utilization substance protein B
MQSLFAYDQCKEAEYLLSQDYIDTFFQPDLNSMKVQDKSLLKGQRVTALQRFEKAFKGEKVPEATDPRVGQAVDESLDQYKKHTKKDFDFFRKNIVSDVEKISGYYHSLLNLIPALATIASQDKKINAHHFTHHPFVIALRNNDELRKETLRRGGSWDQRMDVVKGWWKDCLKTDAEVQKFFALEAPDADAAKAFMKHLIRKVLLGDTAINSHFEEEDLRWAEDHEIVKSLADKTLKSLDEEAKTVELQKLSLDWEEDKTFIEKLFAATTQLDPYYHELIASNTKNWEVDRLPLTDQVILLMAMAELTIFPNIPVKVTINEYIELAKQYSTPKSRQFINGILDVIAKELKATGKIKKSGRGLIDNK